MTIGVNFEELKQMGQEYFSSIDSLEREELDNGLKCFGIAYLNCSFDDSNEIRNERDEFIVAPALLSLIVEAYNKRCMDLLGLGDLYV